jgi:hypothetical protein
MKGSLITEYSNKFGIYSVYIENFDLQTKSIHEEKIKNVKFMKFLEQSFNDLTKKNFHYKEIFSFLIVPTSHLQSFYFILTQKN